MIFEAEKIPKVREMREGRSENGDRRRLNDKLHDSKKKQERREFKNREKYSDY